jgi:hypothetical protein
MAVAKATHSDNRIQHSVTGSNLPQASASTSSSSTTTTSHTPYTRTSTTPPLPSRKALFNPETILPLPSIRVSSTDPSPFSNSLTLGALPNIISHFSCNGGVQQAGECSPSRPFSNIREQDLPRLWSVGCQRDRRRRRCFWVCVTRQLLQNLNPLIRLPFRSQSFFHVDCFQCAKCCNKVTADTNLLLLSDGSPICANCSYCCNVCKLPILDEAIMTGDDSYHAHCFKCKVCGNRIDELVFAKTSQGIYCMNCHNQRVARSRRRHQEKKAAQAQAATNGMTGSSAGGRLREAQNLNTSVSVQRSIAMLTHINTPDGPASSQQFRHIQFITFQVKYPLFSSHRDANHPFQATFGPQ